ncbi:MAG TPA: divalent metal cation transporter, partial [Flavisolibacter sp.]|nr:divalent metal cation transporter [Flavisolibacter sp.]
IPVKLSTVAIVTIVGGTVGGYITFSGAHRLLDAGIKGRTQLDYIDKSAISGILLSTLMRFILFIAIIGALRNGAILEHDNPAAGVFKSAAGEIGLRIFGIVLWSAAISSVIGAAYTSVSFFKTFHPVFQKYERLCISAFIILSTLIFILIGKPRSLLLFAGAANGLILPFALAIILIAATKSRLMKGYHHPKWMQIAGWVVVVVMSYMGLITIRGLL